MFSEITVNNGFCFRCHYGKGGSDRGFVVGISGLVEIQTSAATTANPPPAPTTATPKTPAFTRGFVPHGYCGYFQTELYFMFL